MIDPLSVFHQTFLDVLEPLRMRPITGRHDVDPFSLAPLRDCWQFQLLRACSRVFGMNMPINNVAHTSIIFPKNLKHLSYQHFQNKSCQQLTFYNSTQADQMFYKKIVYQILR